MGVFLKEVMFHFPHEIISQPIGEFDLYKRIPQQIVFAVFIPGARQLMFIENAEFHDRSFCLRGSHMTVAGPSGRGKREPGLSAGRWSDRTSGKSGNAPCPMTDRRPREQPARQPPGTPTSSCRRPNEPVDRWSSRRA